MPTYTYKTIPANSSQAPRQFDVVQRMADRPLTHDPSTGEPVRRVITGGLALKFKGLKRSTIVDKSSPAATACGCATGKPHRHHRHGPGCGHKH